MPSLKEVRNRIVSVGSTMQITSAMKMVSAAKLKRAQDAITQMRPYANKLKELLENVSASIDASENVYARNTGGKNLLIIPISSNRGLAGAFNSNIIKKTNQLIANEYAGYNVTVLSIGKKVQDAFKRTAYNTHGTDLPSHTSGLFEKLNFANTSVVSEKIMEAFLTKQFDKVVLVYKKFCQKLSKAQIIRQNNEGARDFASRACESLPQYHEQIQAITDSYIRLRYGKNPNPQLFQQLNEQVKKFKVAVKK